MSENGARDISISHVATSNWSNHTKLSWRKQKQVMPHVSKYQPSKFQPFQIYSCHMSEI